MDAHLITLANGLRLAAASGLCPGDPFTPDGDPGPPRPLRGGHLRVYVNRDGLALFERCLPGLGPRPLTLVRDWALSEAGPFTRATLTFLGPFGWGTLSSDNVRVVRDDPGWYGRRPAHLAAFGRQVDALRVGGVPRVLFHECV